MSDGIIAPGYEPEALTILSGKKGGKYTVLEVSLARLTMRSLLLILVIGLHFLYHCQKRKKIALDCTLLS